MKVLQEKDIHSVGGELSKIRAEPRRTKIFLGVFFVAAAIIAATKNRRLVEKYKMQRRLPENVSPNNTRTIAVEDIERGFVHTRTGVNEVFDFSPPANATVIEDWRAFGAAEDWVHANFDIFTATLECGSAIASANACFTMLGARLQADAIWPTNRVRHVFGPAEAATLSVEPAVPACSLDFNAMPEGFVVTNIAENLWRLAMPHVPASFTGHIRHGGNSLPIQLQTIAPAPPLAASNPTPISFDEHCVAAGIHMDLEVLPKYVSFTNIRVQELEAIAYRTGYFTNEFFNGCLDHTGSSGANVEVCVIGENAISGGDLVMLQIGEIGNIPQPTAGMAQIDIPMIWYVPESVVTNVFASNIHWNSIDASGTLTVGKYGFSVARGTNDVSTVMQ